MKLFNKPAWLKPEINEPIYYVHLIILSIVALGLFDVFTGNHLLSIKNVLWSIPILTIADGIAHTLLHLD